MQLQHSLLAAAALLSGFASAWEAPAYPGFNNIFKEEFKGSAGSRVDTSQWGYITEINVNNELQKYTTNSRNVQLSGGGTLQLVPWKDANGKWTSGRVEAKKAFTPKDGAITIAEAEIRFGTNQQENKQGLWPAFWLLGEAVRRGIDWPECGEIDILETVNGLPQGHGTVHCDKIGGACNTPFGIGAAAPMPDASAWRTWRVTFDHTNPDWRQQSITWTVNNEPFHAVTGDRIGDEKVWNSLAHSGMYFILNVAVGGDFPGNPNENTLGGYGSMMEVAYTAVYTSN